MYSLMRVGVFAVNVLFTISTLFLCGQQDVATLYRPAVGKSSLPFKRLDQVFEEMPFFCQKLIATGNDSRRDAKLVGQTDNFIAGAVDADFFIVVGRDQKIGWQSDLHVLRGDHHGSRR